MTPQTPPPNDEDIPVSVKTLYDRAEQQRLSLQSSNLPSTSQAFRDALDTTLATYADCARAITSLSLFSPNESLEDLSTPHLPFLQLDFHVATLIERLPTPASSPTSRLAILDRARAAYERFLGLADTYSLLQPPHAAALARYLEAPLEFSTTTTAGTSSDPAARRNAKIANFRTEKELKDRLDALRRNPRYVQDGGGDEELVRETHLAALAVSVHMAFQALDSLNRETELLREQAALPSAPVPDTTEEDDERQRLGPDGYSDRLDEPMRPGSLLGRTGPILSHDGKPLRPFTLAATRQEVQRGVFRPGHNLPTVTIDEYLAEERRRGNIIEGGGEASMQVPDLDEDDYEKADAETMKQRAWDEFKEANPRGWGNTLNRG